MRKGSHQRNELSANSLTLDRQKSFDQPQTLVRGEQLISNRHADILAALVSQVGELLQQRGERNLERRCDLRESRDAHPVGTSFLFFCTCWKVIPDASPSSVCEMPASVR
jgi:hypothetical protein